jgi:hypothetical protein
VKLKKDTLNDFWWFVLAMGLLAVIALPSLLLGGL